MFKSYLQQLMAHETLTENESYEAMASILNGEVTASQISSFISIITFRGASVQELIGLTKAMRNHATSVRLKNIQEPIVDTCGTGGDGMKTFNVSTASAIVASSSGLKVAKHGNKSVSSLSGSADVLEALGLNVSIDATDIEAALFRDNMCFMFAPLYHQAMKHAASTRKEIGFRSVFNLLGPMTNPVGTKHQLIGVYDSKVSDSMALTLKALGAEHVLIVNGYDGIDEFSVLTPTKVTELKNDEIIQYDVAPEDVGLKTAVSLNELQVETPVESAQLIEAILQGEVVGAARDIVAYNAGAALYVGKKCPNLRAGVEMAHQLIASKQAYHHFINMKKQSQEVRHA